MPISPEMIYLQLGRLVADMPDLAKSGPITPEINQWLGRAAALIELVCDIPDKATFKVAATSLDGVLRSQSAQQIGVIAHLALAKAELAAPAGIKGSFIAAGATFDAYAAVGKVLGTANTDVLIVDPYADEKALSDFAVMAPERVVVRLLADQADHKASLRPAALRWEQQFGQARKLEVRLADPKTLHDRLILVDNSTAWALGQSFNNLATRAHTSIVRIDPETAALKLKAYATMWQAAVPL